VAGPHLAGEGTRIALHVVEREMLADAFDVAGEEREYIRTMVGIDGLGEVDRRDLALPVENVVLREVAVDASVFQG
jgi:hypothetical protein